MVNKELYLIPVSSCFTTPGFCRSTISDFQLAELDFIPNSLFELMAKHKYHKVGDIIQKYGVENEENLMEYFGFLNINRYAYFGEKYETELFPDFNHEWDFPSGISNAVIDISGFQSFNYEDLIDNLDKINCFHIQIRFGEKFQDKDKIAELINLANEKSFHTISIYIPFSVYGDFESCTKLVEQIPKIDNATVYGAPENKMIKLTEQAAFVNYTTNVFDADSTCGYIDPKFFSVSVDHFTESQLHNTCLNRKICIDANGFIKNCPSMKHNYGHISDTTLVEAIEKPGFKDCWFIKKDDIDVCQDCEFRHICTDCRAFIKDSDNIYSQPAKCGYNPYIAKWQSEDGWISVEQWRIENPGWEEQAIEIREINKKFLVNNE